MTALTKIEMAQRLAQFLFNSSDLPGKDSPVVKRLARRPRHYLSAMLRSRTESAKKAP